MLKLILILIMNINFISSAVMAAQSDFDKDFQQGLNMAAIHKQQAQQALQQFKPNETFKDYTNVPNESHYYGGVTQLSTPIKEEAIEKAESSDIAKTIRKVDENQGYVDRQALKKFINHGSEIQDHAYNYAKGIPDEFIDCTKKQSCTTQYEEKQCEESPASLLQYCKKSLNINFIPHQTDTHYNLTARLYVKDHNYAGLNINVTNGSLVFLGPHDAHFSLEGRLPSNIDCNSLQGKVSVLHASANLDSIQFPACNNGMVLAFHISGGHSIDLAIDMVSSKITYEPQDHWEDECLGLAHSNRCTFQTEQCVQPSATRTIQNIPVTRDCWEKEASYLCKNDNSSEEQGTCAPLRNQGCEQISSLCKQMGEGFCEKYLRTYRCPIKQCTDTGMICNGTTYCLDGDCVNHQKKPDADFQKAVSVLSASMEAPKEFDQHFIFGGSSKSCRNFMLGAAYCCKDEGWLVDSHLMDCDEEEKKLGEAKEKGLTHYVGRYEEGCVGNICAKKIKAYCIFPSKLARIVQEQGREKQLGRHFGEAEHPDCSGLTVEELQKIDFSRIDFSEFYDDIAGKQKIEDQQTLNQRIQAQMKELIDKKKPHL